ncbi:MAG: triose-phosphate isomerase [Rickettsiales bacterium]|nr:MAG: triose-phosphate isomerase [Rickettsiales bacterium]
MSFISGNWKMNGSKSAIDQWFADFTNLAKENEGNAKTPNEILICVPDVYIEYAIAKANEYNKGTNNFKVNIGAENVHEEEKGAFTGNTSPLFLNEVKCEYTLTGHSERRQFQGETDEVINKKSASALQHNITPVICCGEDLAVRESKKHLEVVGKQVEIATAGLDLDKVIVAYEPVWAIGTGKVPTTEEIDEVCAHIKAVLKKQDLKVLYGGSVKGSNAKEILTLKNVDGVLVGGASLKGADFFDIIKGTF